jgi:hypothetical protein
MLAGALHPSGDLRICIIGMFRAFDEAMKKTGRFFSRWELWTATQRRYGGGNLSPDAFQPQTATPDGCNAPAGILAAIVVV